MKIHKYSSLVSNQLSNIVFEVLINVEWYFIKSSTRNDNSWKLIKLSNFYLLRWWLLYLHSQLIRDIIDEVIINRSKMENFRTLLIFFLSLLSLSLSRFLIPVDWFYLRIPNTLQKRKNNIYKTQHDKQFIIK